ncbi:MAG: DUF924 family protein [Kiloniellales bacterium]|nr:DUF924 family protein [Kiloniellales bacterium]
MTSISDVLGFWFAPGMAARWFVSDPAFDAEVKARLGRAAEAAARGELDHWAETPEGAVALVLLLDQVPRNLYRGDGRAFDGDAAARAVTRRALEAGFDRELDQAQRLFLYLPLEHSEALTDQEDCCRLVEELTDNPDWADYARRHRDIIARFGRFPHRNAALGRESTAEEKGFLEEAGSGF